MCTKEWSLKIYVGSGWWCMCEGGEAGSGKYARESRKVIPQTDLTPLCTMYSTK